MKLLSNGLLSTLDVYDDENHQLGYLYLKDIDFYNIKVSFIPIDRHPKYDLDIVTKAAFYTFQQTIKPNSLFKYHFM